MATLEKKYIYKVFRSGTYLGDLPPNLITNEFGYGQDINTGGCQMNIELAYSLDHSGDAPDPIQTEDLQPLQAEDGDIIYTERAVDLIGLNSDTNVLLRNNNDIQVWEYSDTNPNGVQVFAGYISRWGAKAGSTDNKIVVTVLSYGVELDNYVAKSGSTLVVSQAVKDGSYTISDPNSYDVWGQNFTASGSYSLSQISLFLATWAAATAVVVKLYQGTLNTYDTGRNGAGTLLGTITKSLPPSGVYFPSTFAWVDFAFDTPIALTSAVGYYFTIEMQTPTTDIYSQFGVGVTGTNPVTGDGGVFYHWGGGSNYWYMYTANVDTTYKLWSATGNTTAVYTSTDPKAILTAAVDSYIAQGGNLSYSAATMDATPYLVSYTFNTATILEVIKKCIELAPSDWYWWADPATSLIYFKQTGTTATHTFVLGTHFSEFEFDANVENIRNVVLFTGGDVGGGVNLFRQYTNSASLAANANRQRLIRAVDNRVTVGATADTLGNNLLNENASEQYLGALTIIEGQYDINSIKIGQIVAIRGFGSFLDTLLLQISHIDRRVDSVDLVLGVLPLRGDSYVEDIKRQLDEQQTVANPAAPS